MAIENAIFLGSKAFGLSLFRALVEADRDVKWTLLCPPDQNDARSVAEEFRAFAAANGIDFPHAKSPDEITRYLETARPDVMIVCGYYRILPARAIAAVANGVWGFHNSLLPKYRGGSPLVWQIINREEVIGSSLFRFAAGMDDGAVLDQVRIENARNLTIGEATDRIERAWLEKIPGLWRDFRVGRIEPSAQNHSEATYCAPRKEADGLIDWREDALNIDAFIRAQAAPYPRAFFYLSDLKVRVVRHERDPREISGTAGQVFEIKDDSAVVCCGGSTALRLFEIEIDGRISGAADVLNSVKLRLNASDNATVMTASEREAK